MCWSVGRFVTWLVGRVVCFGFFGLYGSFIWFVRLSVSVSGRVSVRLCWCLCFFVLCFVEVFVGRSVGSSVSCFVGRGFGLVGRQLGGNIVEQSGPFSDDGVWLVPVNCVAFLDCSPTWAQSKTMCSVAWRSTFAMSSHTLDPVTTSGISPRTTSPRNVASRDTLASAALPASGAGLGLPIMHAASLRSRRVRQPRFRSASPRSREAPATLTCLGEIAFRDQEEEAASTSVVRCILCVCLFG